MPKVSKVLDEKFFVRSLGSERRILRVGVFPPDQWIEVSRKVYDSIRQALNENPNAGWETKNERSEWRIK